MPRIYAIVADDVLEKVENSFRFMFESKAPYPQFMDIAHIYGLLTLRPKSANYLNPFLLGRSDRLNMEKLRYEGDRLFDSRKYDLRWNINVYNSRERRLVLGWGADWDGQGNALSEMLKELPDCVLLTHLEVLNDLKHACEKLGIELTVFRYEGILASA